MGDIRCIKRFVQDVQIFHTVVRIWESGYALLV